MPDTCRACRRDQPCGAAPRPRSIASAFGSFSTCTGASMTFSMTVMCCQRLKLWNTMPSSGADALDLARIGRHRIAVAVLPEPDLLAGDDDPPLGRHLEEIDAAQKGALAGSGRADHRYDVALARGHGHALEDFERSEFLVKVVNRNSLGTLHDISLADRCAARTLHSPLRQARLVALFWLAHFITGNPPCNHNGGGWPVVPRI